MRGSERPRPLTHHARGERVIEAADRLREEVSVGYDCEVEIGCSHARVRELVCYAACQLPQQRRLPHAARAEQQHAARLRPGQGEDHLLRLLGAQ
ncbi:MAG: hypothetical protein MUC34_13005, partial [Anaerolineae bacterium]|nr:hypothetical protein [Anaerolineae bacterium]